MENNIKNAINWFLYSGIQNKPSTQSYNGMDMGGSFNAWFDSNKKEYSYVYPEISGYALTLLAYLYSEREEEIFLEKAIQTGNWFLNIQSKEGSFPVAFYLKQGIQHKPEEYYTFDMGMAINGLANLSRMTNKEEYLLCAQNTADWILKFLRTNGSIAAQISKFDGLIKDNDKTWSTQSGAFHAKLAIGLLNLFDCTGLEKYKNAAINLCEYALTCQKITGQFLTYGDLDGTNLHPHCYAAEGLLVAGLYLKNNIFLDAAQKATQWMAENIKDGLIPRHKLGEVYNYNERADILSQGYRLLMFFPSTGNVENREALLKKIVSYQHPENYPREVAGGFRFGKLSNGNAADHTNAWVTMFALQAMILHKNKPLKNIFHLI